MQHHPPCAAAARSFWFHHAAAMLRVLAPSCLLIYSPPSQSLGRIFFPPVLQEEFAYAKHRSGLQHSTRTELTNPNSFSGSPVPSAVVTDGCCEQRGAAMGNNQNRSKRLREQHQRSQPSSGWIPLWTSAGGCCSPGWQAAAPAPSPGNVGCLGMGKTGFGAAI